MKKIKVNKEICEIYAKSFAHGFANGFSTTVTLTLGVLATIAIPGWKNKLLFGTTTVGTAYYATRGFIDVIDDLCMEAYGKDPLPIRLVDSEEECLES